jgi:hypothetical protein
VYCLYPVSTGHVGGLPRKERLDHPCAVSVASVQERWCEKGVGKQWYHFFYVIALRAIDSHMGSRRVPRARLVDSPAKRHR